MSLKTLLEDEITSEFDELGKIQVGTDEYKTTVDGLTKLTDRMIEIEKQENEREDKLASHLDEMKLKIEQLESDKKDRTIRNWLTALGIIVPSGVTIWGALKSWKFEETGVVTSTIGRGFIQKLLKK